MGVRLISVARPRPSWSPALRQLLIGAGSALLLVALFALLSDLVVEDGRQSFDRAVSLAVHRHASPARTHLARLATDLGSALVTIPLCLGMVAWLLRRQRRRAALVVASSWIGAQLLQALLKPFFHRDRPDLFPHLAAASGYSFPSGHTTTAIVTYGLLAYVAGRSRRGWARIAPGLVATGVSAAVACSRVYLGVHYASDVVGSVLVAGAWLRASLLALHLLDPPPRTG